MSRKEHVDPFHEGYTAYCAGMPRSSNPWSSLWGRDWARGWKSAFDHDTFEAKAMDVEPPSLEAYRAA